MAKDEWYAKDKSSKKHIVIKLNKEIIKTVLYVLIVAILLVVIGVQQYQLQNKEANDKPTSEIV